MLLLLLGMRGIPERVPNARRQERHAHVDDFDDHHKDEFEDEGSSFIER
jgi:hypothetical protein